MTNTIIHGIGKEVKKFTRACRRFRTATAGMAAIEMAFVFPLMVIVYFGLVDITNLLSASRRVTISASTLADLVTQAPGTISTDDLNGFYNAVSPIMDPFPSSDVKINIYNYRMNGSNAQLEWSNSKNGTCGGAPSTAGLTNLMTDGNDLVLAKVCIQYVPITGKVFGAGPITLDDQMVLRPRQALMLDCSDC